MLRLNIQFFAHKKGVGSSKNGRDSESKRLGDKTLQGRMILVVYLKVVVDVLVTVLLVVLPWPPFFHCSCGF